MFWVSKYQPKNLGQLDHNPDITDKLFKLSKHDNFPTHDFLWTFWCRGKKQESWLF